MYTIVQKTTPNKSSRCGWVPDIIVSHITEGSFNGAVSWLCNSVSEASAHFVISQKGEITQLVPIYEMAWINGTTTTDINDKRHYSKSTSKLVRDRKTNANLYSVGIEHEGIYSKTKGELTDQQLNATIWLHGYIRDEVKSLYNREIIIDREHILGHYEINPITKPNCPGENFPFEEIIQYFEEEDEMRYNTIEEVPDYAKLTVQKLTDKKLITGTDEGLDLSEDMIRLLVINDRAGLYE